MSNLQSTSGRAERRSTGPGQATVRAGRSGASAAVGFEAEWEAACQTALDGIDLSATPDLLLVFVDSRFAGHYEQIIGRLREATGARHLIGASGQSVIGSSLEAEEGSAIAALGFCLPDAEFTSLPIDPERMDDSVFAPIQDGPEVWLMFSNPFTIMTDRLVGHLQQLRPEVVLLGGMASSHRQQEGCAVFIDDQVLMSGAAMMGLSGVSVRPVVAQGAEPLGQPWIVTECEANTVKTLGSRSALEVLQETLFGLDDATRDRAARNLLVGLAMDEYKDVHERGDFLIRNVMGADRESGVVAINAIPRVGQTLQFQYRDAQAADDDLRARLIDLREALEPEEEVLGALLCSCNGRGRGLFGEPDHDASALSEIFGPVPTAGFFCNGEIGPVGGENYLHGFTASIAVLTSREGSSIGSQ
ncbi:MAG: FIST C-terminal domain-containing protein [Chloroflexi bacterium]|nr:FIST C-terminal domain-containing protein [Chloroflexota bacterium]MCY3696779.1 FIST C-terminal domain-containing protein [Chloroflexota bacterium]